MSTDTKEKKDAPQTAPDQAGLETNYAGAPDEGANEPESNEEAVAQVVTEQVKGGEVDGETQELASDPDIVSKEHTKVEVQPEVRDAGVTTVEDPESISREDHKAAEEVGGGFVGAATKPNPEVPSNVIQFPTKKDTPAEVQAIDAWEPKEAKALSVNDGGRWNKVWKNLRARIISGRKEAQVHEVAKEIKKAA